MAKESTTETLRRYLKDLIAAERSFETQLRSFSKEGKDPDVQALFAKHADETKRQTERLTRRLEEIGGEAGLGVAVKSFVSHLAGMAPKIAKVGQYDAEQGTQNLIMSYAVECSEVATYEALAIAAAAAGDSETEQLARSIQSEEQDTARKIFEILTVSARRSFSMVSRGEEEARL